MKILNLDFVLDKMTETKKPFNRRLISEITKVREAGYCVNAQEDNLYKWEVKLQFDESTSLGQDLKFIRGEDPRIDALLIGTFFPIVYFLFSH